MSRPILVLFCLPFLSGATGTGDDVKPDFIKSARDAQVAGEYQRAKTLFSEALTAAQGIDNADERRAAIAVDLAESLLELGEYARCEKLCVESIASLEKQFGEKHVEIAHAERVLTSLYLRLGMSFVADQHCKRGLKICESIHGPRHPDVAEFHALMHHIWNLRSEDGDSGGGQKSLRIFEAALGKSNPRIIVALEALAGDCYDRWTPEHAARAVSIAETNHGKRHPLYGKCLSTLATALRHTRDFEKSELISKQAIEVLSASLGRKHPQLSAAYRNLASVERERGHSDQSEVHLLDSIRLRFSTLGDAELCHFLNHFIDSDQYNSHDDDVPDMYLTEMTRRGGAVIQEFLTRRIEAIRHRSLQATEQLENDLDFEIFNRMEWYPRNLEFVTTLCRIEKKPGPLQISIEGGREQKYEFPEMPILDVTISNVDAEKRQIGFQESGDYRSGRQARWRIEARDAAGKVRSPKQLHGLVQGGGISQSVSLKPSEGWQTSLTMTRFVDTLESGEYQIHVLYHNDLTIVDDEFVAGLITCRSEPIKLTVKRRAIQIVKEQQQEIKDLVEKLDDGQRCKIIDGKYGEWAHEFIDPKSEYGCLLTLDWSAVPTLIEELKRESQTRERRAHLLALLFSITGENDPRSQGFFQESKVLGPYAVLERGWSITSKRAGEDEPGAWSAGFTNEPSKHEGKIEAKAQAELVERWQSFKRHLEIQN